MVPAGSDRDTLKVDGVAANTPNPPDHADRSWTYRPSPEQLGVNERHIRRLVHERRIPFVKWGHLLRFDPDEIDAWLDAARVPTEA